MCCFPYFPIQPLRTSADCESQTCCCSGQQVWMSNTALDGYFRPCASWIMEQAQGEHFQSRPQSAAEASWPDNRGECSPLAVQNADKYVIRRWYGKRHQSRLMFWLFEGWKQIRPQVCPLMGQSVIHIWAPHGRNVCEIKNRVDSGIYMNNKHFTYLGC